MLARNPHSLLSFADWLGQQNPTDCYDWQCCFNCPVAQYLRANHVDFVGVRPLVRKGDVTREWDEIFDGPAGELLEAYRTRDGKDVELGASWHRVVYGTGKRSWTFGQAHERALREVA